jgi:hypothetical protein
MYAEIRELVDFFAWPMFDGMPTAKVNMFAEVFANDMLVTIVNEAAGGSDVQIRSESPPSLLLLLSVVAEHENGFWVFRDGSYLMPVLAGALDKCCISVPEFFACFKGPSALSSSPLTPARCSAVRELQAGRRGGALAGGRAAEHAGPDALQDGRLPLRVPRARHRGHAPPAVS